MKYAPVITYTEITDEVAPVYLNHEEELEVNNIYFDYQKKNGEMSNSGKSAIAIWMNLLGMLTTMVISVVGYMVYINVTSKKRQNNT